MIHKARRTSRGAELTNLFASLWQTQKFSLQCPCLQLFHQLHRRIPVTIRRLLCAQNQQDLEQQEL